MYKITQMYYVQRDRFSFTLFDTTRLGGFRPQALLMTSGTLMILYCFYFEIIGSYHEIIRFVFFFSIHSAILTEHYAVFVIIHEPLTTSQPFTVKFPFFFFARSNILLLPYLFGRNILSLDGRLSQPSPHLVCVCVCICICTGVYRFFQPKSDLRPLPQYGSLDGCVPIETVLTRPAKQMVKLLIYHRPSRLVSFF